MYIINYIKRDYIIKTQFSRLRRAQNHQCYMNAVFIKTGIYDVFLEILYIFI